MPRPFLPAYPGILALALAAAPASAATLASSAIGTRLLSGSRAPASGNVYSDDVMLESLSFGDVAFSTGNSFSAVTYFEVLSGFANINAEWGDHDTAADGDPDPFTKAGHAGVSQETTDRAIQNATLLNAFNSLSLSEMSDGEDNGGFSFKVLFADGLRDNAAGPDDTPEMVFFERGMNDTFRLEAIIGGTFADPVYAPSILTLDSGTFGRTGVNVNTVEIQSGQELGAGGIDISEFGIGLDAVVYGFRMTVLTGGPDLNGFFLSAVDPESFEAPLQPDPNARLPAVPAPAALPLLGVGVVALTLVGRRRSV